VARVLVNTQHKNRPAGVGHDSLKTAGPILEGIKNAIQTQRGGYPIFGHVQKPSVLLATLAQIANRCSFRSLNGLETSNAMQ
jgi:hypothetical protein